MLSLSVDGRVDGSNVMAFRDSVEAAIGEGDRAVIMDFGNLVYISSAGLRAVLLTGKSLKGRNAELLLCSLQEPIRRVFEVSGFDKLFAIHDMREDAIAAVGD